MSEPEKVDHKAAIKKYILGAEKRHKKLPIIEEMEKSATKGEARRKLKKFLSTKGL